MRRKLWPLFMFVMLSFGFFINERPVQAGGAVPPYFVWSQDGSVIVWETGGYGGNIYAAKADGSQFWIIAQDCSCRLIGIGLLPDDTKVVWYFEELARSFDYGFNLDTSTRYEISSDLRTAWFSPDGRQVIFGRDNEIYKMNTDGSHLVQLTENAFEEELIFNDFRSFRPQSYWSPDGSQIAFHRFENGIRDVYVMNADGTNIRNVSQQTGDDFFRSWSPDSHSIAFENDYRLYLANLESTSTIPLSADLNSAFFESWSPDGRRIVFSAMSAEGEPAYYLINVDGTELQSINTDDFRYSWYAHPRWSEDSQNLYLEVSLHREDVPSSCVARANADGTNLQCVLEGGYAGFTPDGERFVQFSYARYGVQILLIEPSGQEADIVIETPTYEMALTKIERAEEEAATMLDLSYMYLTELPPEIGNLTDLTSLDLSYNHLTALPSEIGHLTQLTSLNLGQDWDEESGNELSVLLPEIGNLSRLRQLNLSGNHLSSLPPEIGNLAELTSLSLGWNELSTLPPELFRLRNLEILILHSNRLSVLPPEIVNLRKLNSLDLSNNLFTVLPEELANMPSLNDLYIDGNPIPNLRTGHIYPNGAIVRFIQNQD